MRNTIHSFWHHKPCTLQSHQSVILTQFYGSKQGQIVHKVVMNILAFEHTFSFFIPSDTLRRNDFLEIRYRMKTQSKCYNGSGRQCIKILHCWWITLKARLTRMRNEMDNSVNRFCHQRNCLTLWQRRFGKACCQGNVKIQSKLFITRLFFLTRIIVENAHQRQSTSRPGRRDMECHLWVHNLIFVLHLSLPRHSNIAL